MAIDPALLAALRPLIRDAAAQARGLCILTGAGISAESGIATFRDAMTGLWSRFDPMTLASEEGFRADPARVWRWYAERRDGVRRAQPNAGHVAVARFAARHPGAVTVVTQNVDDLHQRAGVADTIRLHGDILQDRWLDRRCLRGGGCDPARAAAGEPPACAECGNLVRPGVVWFGEALPAGALDAAERAADDCALLLVVGTSGAVWPAAGLAGRARRGGAAVVIVNPQESEIDDEADHLVRAPAAAALPLLLQAD